MIRPIANALLRDVRQRAEAKHLRAVASRCDAFLTSYPKCGRTWLRYLLSHYLAETVGLGFQPDLVSTFRILPNFDCDTEICRAPVLTPVTNAHIVCRLI